MRRNGVHIGAPQIIAMTGWTTDEELGAAIDEVSPKGPFTLVTLLIGVNDQYRGRSVDDYRRAFVGRRCSVRLYFAGRRYATCGRRVDTGKMGCNAICGWSRLRAGSQLTN